MGVFLSTAISLMSFTNKRAIIFECSSMLFWKRNNVLAIINLIVITISDCERSSADDMKSTNDYENGSDDFVDVDEEQARHPRAASLEKLVDFCAEEFGKAVVILLFM